MLASCGLCYYAESDEDACICRECQGYVTMEELEADILLADTLPDPIRQQHHIGILASGPTTPGDLHWAY